MNEPNQTDSPLGNSVFPAVYNLFPSALYSTIETPMSSTRFRNFHMNPIYLFPVIDKQTFNPNNELIIKSSQVAHMSTSFIEFSIKRIEKDSPFQKLEDIRLGSVELSDNPKSSYRESFCSNSFTDKSEEGAPRKAIGLEEQKLIKQLHREHAPHELPSFPSFDEMFSINADNASILDEGVPNALLYALPEEGLSLKNPLLGISHPRVHMMRLPEKRLSLESESLTQQREECPIEFEDFYSPVQTKAAVCKAQNRTKFTARLCLEQSFYIIGFISAPSIRYSETDYLSKSLVKNAPDKVYIALLSHSILDFIAKHNVAQVAFSYEFGTLLTAEGLVMSWGYGGSGGLGHGDTESSHCPSVISALSRECVVHIESGGYHSLAITEQGQVYTWGRGDVYQLGVPYRCLAKDEMGYVALVPIKIMNFSESTIKLVSGACGEAHTMLLDDAGSVYVFGWGEDGQLGVSRHQLNKAMISAQLVKLDTLNERVLRIRAGALFSACLTVEGRVFVWGNGEQGQLGQGKSLLQSDFPVLVEELAGEELVDIQCGESHMLVLSSEGRVWGWGLGQASKFNGKDLPEGSDVVCYTPKALSQVKSVYHLCIDQD